MRVRRYGILLAVLLVSLLLLTVQTRGGGTGRASELVTIAVTPVQSLLVRIHRGALNFWANYVDWKSVRRENATLREENEHLRVQALQAGDTREENARLRRLLVLRDRLPLATVSGEVIGREAGGWVRSLTVNRGRGDGIAQQTPVIVPDGLVGRVVQVHRAAAVVQLLNDPASTVGAVVQRTRTAGLVEGDAGGTVRFKFMARDGASVSGKIVSLEEREAARLAEIAAASDEQIAARLIDSIQISGGVRGMLATLALWVKDIRAAEQRKAAR